MGDGVDHMTEGGLEVHLQLLLYFDSSQKKTRSHCNCLKNYWKHTDATRYGHLPSVDESIHLFKSNPEPFHLDAIKLTDIEHECW